MTIRLFEPHAPYSTRAYYYAITRTHLLIQRRPIEYTKSGQRAVPPPTDLYAALRTAMKPLLKHHGLTRTPYAPYEWLDDRQDTLTTAIHPHTLYLPYSTPTEHEPQHPHALIPNAPETHKNA